MHCRAQVAEISTHAPRTGSDPRAAKGAGRPANFNPRSPHGERRQAASSRPCAAHISTHAPRTGSDVLASGAGANPGAISTHAPRTGSDLEELLHMQGATCISTHAPRTGSDPLFPLPARCQTHFNPRSPHGERHGRGRKKDQKILFQPTLPARGATNPVDSHKSFYGFQPTLPARGATSTPEGVAPLEKFQPTLPARGATAQSNNSVDQNHRLCTKSIPQNSPFEN